MNNDNRDDTTPPHAEPLQLPPLPHDDGRQAALARLLDELEKFFAKGTTETEMRFLNKVQRLKYSRSTAELLSTAEWGS